MTTIKHITSWWVEPDHTTGKHEIRASVRYTSGRTLEVSHLAHQKVLDSAIVPRWYIGRILFNMKITLNEAINRRAKP